MNDIKKLQAQLIQSVGCGRVMGHGEYCDSPEWCCGSCSQAIKTANALTPVIELIEASLDELTRSKLVSLPLKLEFARANGLVSADGFGPLVPLEAWMVVTRQRFEAAVKAFHPEHTNVG